jgi:biopolymer transport protein ExbB
MWALILERTWFLRARLGKLANESLAIWNGRPEHQSWQSFRIRELLISDIKMAANARLPMIKTLVALCPLLGLLGTVTGMIRVFDAMAYAGTGDARAMASGVSMATVPTMAGMVGALSGVLLVSVLNGWARRQVNQFHDQIFSEQGDER